MKNDELRKLVAKLNTVQSEEQNKATALSSTQKQLAQVTEQHSQEGHKLQVLQVKTKAVFYYCCPDCPVHLSSIGWVTRAVWTAVKKYNQIRHTYCIYICFISCENFLCKVSTLHTCMLIFFHLGISHLYSPHIVRCINS